jgi:catechol 2,3-dioxygenase-like lactoylglutathione lyase family enzyme
MTTTGLNHITFAVNNVSQSIQFYTEILGLRLFAKWSKGAYLTAGRTWIALIQDATIKQAHRPDYSHIASRANKMISRPYECEFSNTGASNGPKTSPKGIPCIF